MIREEMKWDPNDDEALGEVIEKLQQLSFECGKIESGSLPEGHLVLLWPEDRLTYIVEWSIPQNCYMAKVEGAPHYAQAKGESAEEALVNLKREIRLQQLLDNVWKER